MFSFIKVIEPRLLSYKGFIRLLDAVDKRGFLALGALEPEGE
jgi:hypothetical protein